MGFDPTFIQGFDIALPTLSDRIAQEAFDKGSPIEHTRYSVVFSQQRGLAIFSAHNIDGATIIAEGEIPRKDRFRLDPDVPPDIQVDNNRGYRKNPWDRGHLVRRRALHWGDRAEAQRADHESYFWTNIAPQHKTLHATAWGRIEDWMLLFTDAADQGAAVFTGPVLLPEDPQVQNQPGEDPIQIPSGFWKVMAIRSGSELRAAGFLVWQRDFDRAEPVQFSPFLEQVRVTTLEFLTGLSFGELREVDPLRFGTPPQVSPTPAGAAAAEAPQRPETRALVVTSAQDIYLPGANPI